MNTRNYSDEEAREILRRAVDHQERGEFQYSEQQLFDMGRELGLSRDAIVKAEHQVRGGARPSIAATFLGNGQRELSTEEAAFQRERVQPLRVHFVVFLAAIPLLIILNFLTGIAFPWFLIALSGWAMGLAGHYFELTRTEGGAYEKAYQKWQVRRQRRLPEK